MFLVSTRLGLIVCRQLVRGYEEGIRLTAPELAAMYNMNVRILNTSLRSLVKAGILNSQVGGVNPGFIYSRDPKTISLYSIVTAFEGETKMMCCQDLLAKVKCDMENCANCLIYGGINKSLKELTQKLQSLTIYDHYRACVDEKKTPVDQSLSVSEGS